MAARDVVSGCGLLYRIKLLDVIDPEVATLVKPEKATSAKKKETSSYLNRRLKRLRDIAVANNNKTTVGKVDEVGGANSDTPPSRVLMAKTENFVHKPFQQNQEVKVWEWAWYSHTNLIEL